MFALVVFACTETWPLVGPAHLTTYPAIADAPVSLGASQFKETVFVETPVTFKFRTLEGVVGFGATAGAIRTLLVA